MKLNIYMKSGNVIKIDGVASYRFNNNEVQVDEFHISQSVNAKNKLIVSTIDLCQIEAVTVEQETTNE